ncbi:AfsR/SARP family transcriptional regulator [Microlunatus parietis]|uniref:DNA-binding SARP family transcriptional activator/tetratricopeptide (TPR) repeat protein n=1 Tax=Microlunatus parietis TaxID=682979 RepID=A0A7Y9I5E7_9ACTN|nr:BTAD domain-containing putative transcriptional regulator [Microlunatus parietis]NYE70627.1 DNA-binding SARP family transcriptional activator/tetratricopeptide (TPR) repeat protein [Microlunatus parietis]
MPDSGVRNPTKDRYGVIFQILGPMLITGEAAARFIPGTKPRQLLGLLLLHANRFVSTDHMADSLWDGEPPGSAGANLRSYIRKLRTTLQERGVSATIETRPGGYALMVGTDDVDTSRVEAMRSEVRHLTTVGDYASALVLLDTALDLWRGSLLEDVPVCLAWQPQLTRWDLARAEMLDDAIGLQIEHGDPRRAAQLVREALDRDPYNEDLWCLLLRCFLAADQPAFARQAADEGEKLFAEELGVAPGPDFAALAAEARAMPARRTLTPVPRRQPDEPAKPDRAAEPPVSDRSDTGDPPFRREVPTQLPMDVADFTGREVHLAELVESLRTRTADRPLVVAISGPPGIGKTALAIRIGHLVRDSFLDGQIFLSLHGDRHVDPTYAVAEALTALGVQTVPERLDRAAALLRSELASRRVLLIIDDVGTASQVEELLPGTGDTVTLLTSRRRLTEIAGIRSLELGELEPAEAEALIEEIAPGRDAADRRRLAAACGRHPLALRIAAARLSRRPDLSVAELVRRLSDPDQALNELTLGETAFRSSADLSARSLGPADATAYRVLGALEATEFPGWVVELASGSSRTADNLLEENLLQLVSRGQAGTAEFRMHDLLRWHAREWGAEHRAETVEGVRRVLLGWLVRAREAAAALPFEFLGVAFPMPDEAPDPPPDATAEDWFAGEQGRLIDLVATARRYGADDLAWRLVCTWSAYFDLRGHTQLWHHALTAVLPSSNGLDDPLGEATVLRDLAQIDLYRADLDLAADKFRRSRALFQQLEHLPGVGVTEIGLATTHRMMRRFDIAEQHAKAALDCFRTPAENHLKATAMSAMAAIHIAADRKDQAESWLLRARDLAARIGDQHRVATVLRRLAALHHAREDYPAGRAAMTEALAIFDALSDDRCATQTRVTFGIVLTKTGDLATARRELNRALGSAERAGELDDQALILESLGEVSLLAGRRNEAIRLYRRAARQWQVCGLQAEAERAERRGQDIAAGDREAVR